ncbi:hypothetical protein PAAG_02583 [Paracoccidioides lutzii Pb01]|uniref:Exosome complex subunit Csl4 n=1 Tax=Paracoccidioides lutzii (strain ATCC MYA-826 / Pb01) TaxID=502779 RepID=C1GVB0_PARBA|nr:hypothetical protein PAAG_02583 [Paracoccidioides lutzii Pb01]EEH40528.1 hypothetical protein PAAG_02583 [Paracoccidioides lutzii Pb01]
MAIPLPSIAVPGQRLGPASSFIPGPGTHIQDSFVCASIAGPVILKKIEELSKQQQQQANTKQRRELVTIARSFAQTVNDAYADAGKLPQQQVRINGTQHSQRQLNAATTTTTTTTTTSVATTTTKRQKYKYNTLPAVDSIVLARVTRVQKRQATLSILVILDDNHPVNPTSPSYDTSNTVDPSLLSTTNADPLNADDLRFQALIRKEDVRTVEKDSVVMDEMFRVGDIVRAVVISLGDQSFYYCSTARNELGVVMGRSEAGNVLVPVSWREMVDGKTGRREWRKVARPF